MIKQEKEDAVKRTPQGHFRLINTAKWRPVNPFDLGRLRVYCDYSALNTNVGSPTQYTVSGE